MQTTSDTIFELRDYLMRPGGRDRLIEMFERLFIESQEAGGSRVVGAFRDLDRPDHFVWMRSFMDLETRPRALDAFYTSALWREQRNAANATMIDSDNVRMLHPVGAAMRLPRARAGIGVSNSARSMIVLEAFSLERGDAALHAIAARDARFVAAFATEDSENNYPRLPVRTDKAFVTMRRFELNETVTPIADMPPALETFRLEPTSRSLLR